MLTQTDDIRATDTDEGILIFDVSDDALERAAPIIGGVASGNAEFWYWHSGQLRMPLHRRLVRSNW
jgi:hypothetical protein